MAQDKTLGRGEGLGMAQRENREAIYQGLFEEAKKEIALDYLPGTMAYLKLHHPKLYDEVLVTEMRLDDLWRSMRKGKDTLEQFQETLTTWKGLHSKAIELYRGKESWRDLDQKSLF
jgi:uncharacterized protein (DUF2342 family)